MARRPIFIPTKSGYPLVDTKFVEFEWHPGLHVKQKQKSIAALHSRAQAHLGLGNILDISTKSTKQIGVSLSAFNLSIHTQKYHRTFSVEAAYQGSKVFERGGPFKDLLEKTAREAKSDPRLRQSGRLVGFSFLGVSWPLEPKTAFYDWLYVNALRKKPDLVSEISEYEAFSDIEFNPEKSINCQAYSAALVIALTWRGLLEESIAKKDGFLRALGRSEERAHQAPIQGALDIATEVQERAAKPYEMEVIKMTRFGSKEFESWDALSEVLSLVKSWKPEKNATERAYESELHSFLVRELPDVDVTWDGDPRKVPADFVVADSVAVELKRNFVSNDEYDQLLGQIKSMKDWSGAVIVLLLGRTNLKLVKALQAKVKTWHSKGDLAANVKVVRKVFPVSGRNSALGHRAKRARAH